MLLIVTIIMITLSSLGNLFIYTLRGKSLDLKFQYSALGTAGIFLPRPWEAQAGDIYMSWGHPESNEGIFMHERCMVGILGILLSCLTGFTACAAWML